MSLSRGRRLGLIIVASILVVVSGGMLISEIALRAVATERLAAATSRLDDGGPLGDSTIRLDDSPLLWQLATGGPRAEVTIPASALDDLLGERVGGPVNEVWFESGLVMAALDVALRGTPTRIEVGLSVGAVDGTLVATPELLRVGGVQLPTQLLTRLLGDSVVDGFSLASALSGGVEIVSATVTDDSLVTVLLLSKGTTP